MNQLTSIEELQNKINSYLQNNIKLDTDDELITDAMEYSLNAGGKRLRPALTLRIVEALTRTKITDDLVKVASAIELIHTYSLVHDDLPAMDNDDLRRGKPTNHKKFGEGLAVLAGDALLTLAFQWVAENNLPDGKARRLTIELAKFSGPAGMVAGQSIDIANEGQNLNYEEVKNLHAKKTGALIQFSTKSGAIIAGVSNEVIAKFASFGRNYGLAFQIYDDLMDELGTVEEMGKAVHKDFDERKNTYPGLFGIEGAKEKLQAAIDLATQDLKWISENSKIKISEFDDFLAYFKI